MADFDDITGWQEELEHLLDSETCKNIYGDEHQKVGADPQIPFSVLCDYVELLLKHKETRDAIVALTVWSDNQTEDFVDTDNDPTWPHREEQLISNFVVWFTLKSGHHPNDWAYIRHGRFLASSILKGVFPSVRCKELREYVAQNASFDIDVSR